MGLLVETGSQYHDTQGTFPFFNGIFKREGIQGQISGSGTTQKSFTRSFLVQERLKNRLPGHSPFRNDPKIVYRVIPRSGTTQKSFTGSFPVQERTKNRLPGHSPFRNDSNIPFPSIDKFQQIRPGLPSECCDKMSQLRRFFGKMTVSCPSGIGDWVVRVAFHILQT